MSVDNLITQWGGYFGVLATVVTIYREATKGPKVTIKEKESLYYNHSITTQHLEKDEIVTSADTLLLTRIQLHNSGNELTSVINVHLELNDGTKLVPQKTHKIEAGESKNLRVLNGVPVRMEDEKIITLAPGEACLESFQFDLANRRVSLESFSIKGSLIVELINHSKLKVEVEFKDTQKPGA